MAFYPDIKRHISPSALANWHEARSLFVRSYFQGEKSPETSAMTAGKQIHALIESGIFDVKCRYGHVEEQIIMDLPDIPSGEVKVLGIPDSFERHWSGAKEGDGEQYDTAFFVDYKTGKENRWDNAKLAADLKMKMTAWLVWHRTGRPAVVKGSIEYIPTQWNPVTCEIEPVGESFVAAEIEYAADEMESFMQVILKTIEDVNAAYEDFLASTDEFISREDVMEYSELEDIIRKVEARQQELLERIAAQMDFGGKQTYQSPIGTFFFKETKKYEYPDSLIISDGDLEMPLASLDRLTVAAMAAKKKFETENEPVLRTRKLQFRTKKK